MTVVSTRKPILSVTYRDWRSCLSGWAILLVAIGLVSADTPSVLRIIALPALIAIPGLAVVRLLYRDRPVAIGDPDWAPLDRSADPALRALLTVLIGILLTLPAALALYSFGIAITAASLALTVGSVGIVLVGAATWWVPVTRQVGVPRVLRAARLRRAGAVAAGAASVVVALGIALAMSHQPVDRYTTIGFIDTKAFTAQAFSAAPGAPVRLNWQLDAYHSGISADLTTVQVEVDGNPVGDLAVDLGTVTNSPAGSVLTGSATFAAPAVSGRHNIKLTIATADADGAAVPQPGFLTTTLEVVP